jgi:hypothetical protein
MFRSVNEEWLQRRREEYSSYMGYFVTEEIQNKFQKITGLEDDIVKCDKDIEMQLWIDNIVDKLCKKYESIDEKKNNICDILLQIGFDKQILREYGILDNEAHWVYGHMQLDENIESLIDYIFRDFID